MLVRRVAAGDASELLGVAGVVWAVADRPLTLEAMAAEVPETDRRQLGELVDELVAAGWLVRSDV